MEVIRTQNIEIGYESRQGDYNIIMDNINLSLCKGDFVSLIGKNGIGKTTLLRTLAGLQDLLEGNIFINNKDLEKYNLKDLAKCLSIVLTERYFFDNVRVYELIALGRFPHTNWLGKLTDKDKEIINNSINIIGLENFKDRLFNELSDGEKQKVMLSRALAQDTDIIILDEPTAHLDVHSRLEIFNLLKKLAKDYNKAILLSTHDLDIAIHTSNKMWIMTNETIHTGIPEDLVLNGLFNKIFDGDISFDMYSGHFKIKQGFTHNIKLTGEGVSYIWTKMALERIGYVVIDNNFEDSDINIKVTSSDNKINWELKNGLNTMILNSIEDLLKNI